MESNHDPNSKTEILKTIEEIFEKERNDPDPEVRDQAIKETEMLKKQASSLVDSLLSMGGKRLEPRIPPGYRLPTESEYRLIEEMGRNRKDLSDRINRSLIKDEKKELLQQYRVLVHKLTGIIESGKIYYVPGSNRFIGSKNYL